MKKTTNWIKLLSLFISLIWVFECSALKNDSQLSISVGMVNGSFAGAVTQEFAVPQGLNFRYELFRKPKKSYFVRGILAMDAETGKTRYAYSGVGASYYFKSTGMAVVVNDKQFGYTLMPRWRYYYGWDTGISHVVVKNFGTILSTSASLIDLGGHIGTTYQIGKNWGIDAQLGYRFGYSFSSVAVTGTIMNIFFGGSYFL